MRKENKGSENSVQQKKKHEETIDIETQREGSKTKKERRS